MGMIGKLATAKNTPIPYGETRTDIPNLSAGPICHVVMKPARDGRSRHVARYPSRSYRTYQAAF